MADQEMVSEAETPTATAPPTTPLTLPTAETAVPAAVTSEDNTSNDSNAKKKKIGTTDEEKGHKAHSSYHYWHTHGKQRAAVGDVAPMPVAQLVHSAPIDPSRAAPAKRTKDLSKYSWCNNNKTVSVYVPFDAIVGPAGGTIEEASVSVTFTDETLKLVVDHDNCDHVLHLALAKTIDPARSKHRVKTDQVVITVAKPEGNTDTWFDLISSTHFGNV